MHVGHLVLYTSAHQMLSQLRASRADNTYDRRLLRLSKPHLLIIDDLGLRPLKHDEPMDLYDVISRRYERGSIIITSNRDVEEWAPLFHDELLAGAAMDRLLHHSHTVAIEGGYATRMANFAHQADLDDLLASCRSPNARRAFADAVASYKVGAYRAAIVGTWTAVVFDYLAKLRELELSGNTAAAQRLKSFEDARSTNDVQAAQRLESAVLDDAAETFELLTPIEKEDLQRLMQDRHRSAHPSLLTLDEPYEPPAELARCHMRTAVTHLLSRPPLQGREAWDRIYGDVTSAFFPESADEAQVRLQPRLSRARPTLIRRLVVELTKMLLSRGEAEAHSRLRAALLGTVGMHHAVVEQLLREKLDSLVDAVHDEDVDLVVAYCRHVPLASGALSEAHYTRLRSYLEQTDEMQALADGLEITELRESALRRVPTLSDRELVDFASHAPREQYADEIVRRFESATSFATFRDLRPAFGDESLLQCWTLEHKRRLVATLTQNTELPRYMAYGAVVEAVLGLCGDASQHFKSEWRAVYDSFAGSDGSRAQRIIRALRLRFPEFPEPGSA